MEIRKLLEIPAFIIHIIIFSVVYCQDTIYCKGTLMQHAVIRSLYIFILKIGSVLYDYVCCI